MQKSALNNQWFYVRFHIIYCAYLSDYAHILIYVDERNWTIEHMEQMKMIKKKRLRRKRPAKEMSFKFFVEDRWR
jgi:hypothetical protein